MSAYNPGDAPADSGAPTLLKKQPEAELPAPAESVQTALAQVLEANWWALDDTYGVGQLRPTPLPARDVFSYLKQAYGSGRAPSALERFTVKFICERLEGAPSEVIEWLLYGAARRGRPREEERLMGRAIHFHVRCRLYALRGGDRGTIEERAAVEVGAMWGDSKGAAPKTIKRSGQRSRAAALEVDQVIRGALRRERLLGPPGSATAPNVMLERRLLKRMDDALTERAGRRD